MRKSLLLVLLVVVLLAMTAAPGVAAPGNGAEKDTYYVYECFGAPDMSMGTVWEAGPTLHVRGWLGEAVELFYDETLEAWLPGGENHTVINFNAKTPPSPMDFPLEPWRLWGTFDIELDGIGNFEGTWSTGMATGKEVGGERLMKTDLRPESIDDFPAPGPVGCSPIVITIIDPGH